MPDCITCDRYWYKRKTKCNIKYEYTSGNIKYKYTSINTDFYCVHQFTMFKVGSFFN